MLFHDRRPGIGGKKSHLQLLGTCGKDSYSVGAGEYSVREFQAQRTDFHGEARPRRLLMDFHAQIPWLLNDEPFGSTRSLASQFVVTRQ
jgi:hypothetical protein